MRFIAKFIRTSTIEIEASNIDEAVEKALTLNEAEIGEWSEAWIADSVEVKQ